MSVIVGIECSNWYNCSYHSYTETVCLSYIYLSLFNNQLENNHLTAQVVRKSRFNRPTYEIWLYFIDNLYAFIQFLVLIVDEKQCCGTNNLLYIKPFMRLIN